MKLKEPRAYRFTRKQYYALGEIGMFDQRRVELIDGEILEVSRISPRHASALNWLNPFLINKLRRGLYVRPRQPLDLGPYSDPEPDIAICKGAIRDCLLRHPQTAELVIEVSEKEISYDRTKRGSLYAKANIPDYWIVNLLDGYVEIYRDPVKAKGHFFGSRYAAWHTARAGESVQPLCLPQAKIAVNELLPPEKSGG